MKSPTAIALAALLAALSAPAEPLAAMTAEDLPPGVPWRVADIEIEGNDAVPTSDLTAQMLTKERDWYAPWRERPAFDGGTFTNDLDRLERVYESRGYYHAEITYELVTEPEDELVAIRIEIDEGPPVRVAEVGLEVVAAPPLPPTPEPTRIPLRPGEIFDEERYQLGDTAVSDFFLDHGYARVTTKRAARVDVDTNRADVAYSAVPGEVAAFGETTVEGTADVDPEIILRELRYEPGDRFSLGQLRESRTRILALGLFRSVRLTPDLEAPEGDPVPIRIDVQERPPREIRIGAGYGTDDGIRGQIEWRSLNWFGDGRQLSIRLKGSQVFREATVRFLQPHLFAPENRGSIEFSLFQEDEQTFLRNATQLIPMFQRQLTPELVGFIGYRVEYDSLSQVDEATRSAIGGVIDDGILSAPILGFLWNTADDPLNPKRGHTVSFDAIQGGGIWGGPFDYWRVVVEGKKYVSVGWEVVLAGRLKIGLADSFGAPDQLPLFERFYAGGERSVRGYFRRRLGPLSTTNRPLGGPSLFEGSVEARRPIWGALGGAVFLDFGNVSLQTFDPPIGDLKFAPGFGVTYDTPVGPLRLDIGFPIDPPPSDAAWQLHFSIGQFF